MNHSLLTWLILFFLNGLVACVSQEDKYIDPTGTYNLVSKTTKIGDDIYGRFGEIKIIALSKNKIVMNYFICKGAPSYNNGGLLDTLDYNNNTAIYTCVEYDKSCEISFCFNETSVTVKEETNNVNYGCGFGHAVVADGVYKKTSDKIPIIKYPGE